MKTDLRRLVAALAKADPRRTASGDAGELFAKKWLERSDMDYYRFPQTPSTKPASLVACGGKRPDFAVEMKDVASVVYVDAKFHKTNNVAEFTMKDSEIAQYEAFRGWALRECGDDGDRHVLFMLYPKELNGDKFVWIHLDEMSSGIVTTLDNEPARKISLTDREGLWVDNLASGA